MMSFLALFAPLGAVVLSILLALAVCYAAIYAMLHQYCCPTDPVSDTDADRLEKAVNMLGLHIEGVQGVSNNQDAEQSTHQQDVVQLFRLHGHRNSNAYATISNPELQVLLLPGVGCMVLTTCQHWGLKVVVAVGDPVCDPQHDLQMLRAFKAAFPAGILVDVSKDVARLWAQVAGPSSTVTDMGTETLVDVQAYSFEFNKRTKEIRRNADAAARAGLVVEEVTAHSSAGVKEQVQQLAAEWQQGKAVTDHLKVFSRAIPFQHLGREKDVRVFIARTLEPGEAAAPFTVAMAAEQLEQQKATAAAGTTTVTLTAMTEDGNTCTSSSAGRSSEQQRMKRARRAAARQQKQQPGASVAAADCTAAAAAATAADGDCTADLSVIITCSSNKHLSSHDYQKQQQQQRQQHETASIPAATSCGSSGSGELHACAVLDPLYRHGEVVGYLVSRTLLSPKGIQGAPKLILKEVMQLLKAEGRCILNHGLAPAHSTKAGDMHGFTDCAWVRRSYQLCWEHGNSLYAFKNLAMAKSSWGGGYNSEGDSLKYQAAVTLNRRFMLLPPSWCFQLGHGPLLLMVAFRHVGLLGDPWALFAFWRYQ